MFQNKTKLENEIANLKERNETTQQEAAVLQEKLRAQVSFDYTFGTFFGNNLRASVPTRIALEEMVSFHSPVPHVEIKIAIACFLCR